VVFSGMAGPPSESNSRGPTVNRQEDIDPIICCYVRNRR
jgi:hypothetical protein